MQTPEEFAWTLYEAMDFHDHSWRDPEATARLIRARDAEVAEQALAGFGWETTNRTMPKVVPCDCAHPQHAGLVVDDSPPTHVSFDFVPHRRLVGPWEPDGNPTEGETDE